MLVSTSASRSSPRVSKRAKPRLGISIAMQPPLTANSPARPAAHCSSGTIYFDDVAKPHGLLPRTKDRTSHCLELGPSEGPNDAGVSPLWVTSRVSPNVVSAVTGMKSLPPATGAAINSCDLKPFSWEYTPTHPSPRA